MTHAELYVIACQYMLDGLKNMAWQRLRAVLISMGSLKRNTPVIDNLVTLISYVYHETGDDKETEEPLRMLITTFTSLNFTNFQSVEVDKLVNSASESDREFVADFMLKVAEKVAHLESRNNNNGARLEYCSECSCSRCRPPRKKKGRKSSPWGI